MNESRFCLMSAADAGGACIDSRQCLGACLAPSKAVTHLPAIGHCSEYIQVFGTATFVRFGIVQRAIAID